MPLTEHEMRETIVGEQNDPRRLFLERFTAAVEPIIIGATVAHHELENLGALCAPSDRLSRVYLFLHVALNSVVSSTRLLVEGFPLDAGHRMRHYGEASAMAMLLADPK